MANLLVTDAGIAAIRNAQATGTNEVAVGSVRVGSGQWTPDASATDLRSLVKTYAAFAGGVVGDNVIHVEAVDTSSDAFTAYEIGVFLEDGTLLAVASSTTAILEKASASQALLAVDIAIADAGDTEFVFPSATFSVPPATTEIQGVVELATVAEGLAGTDAIRAMTPADVKAVADTKAPVNHASTANTYGAGSASNYGHVRLSDSTSSESGATGATAATPLAVKNALDSAIAADAYKVAKAGDTVTGTIHSTYGKANTSGVVEQFGGEMAASDRWRIGAGATASDAGFLEIATADNGNEPIYVRQYSGGTFGTLARQVALLDGSGKTTFPVSVTCPSFIGALTGNASTATKLQTARSITVKDNAQSNAGPAQNFDGSANIFLRLPATIKGTLDGNAATATKAVGDTNGARIDTTYLKLAGGTVTGTLVLSRTTDLSGTADNGPALVIGGTRAQAHIEIDNNEIQAKANGNTVSALYLQPDGGICNVNGKRVVRGSGGGAARGVYVDGDGNVAAMSSTVGGTARGVYLKGGTVAAMSATVGGTSTPVFMNGGTITKLSATVGSTTQPVFLSGGQLKACNAYSTVSMVPNWSARTGRSAGTTYTAGTNGFALIYGRQNNGQDPEITINGQTYNNSFWSYTGHQNKYLIYPIAKGDTYKMRQSGYWIPAK